MNPVRSNLHTHTTYVDGENTMEEMIQAAIALGFESIGLSEHAYAPYESLFAEKGDITEAYREEAYALKERYAGKIDVYVGLEVDSFHLHDKSRWDYVIGSVHHIKGEKGYHTIDHTPQLYDGAIEAAGGLEAMLEQYITSVVELAEGYRPDILGHIDVVTKLARQETRPLEIDWDWYERLWEAGAARIAAAGCIVEVNTAPIYRGYGEDPYPHRQLLAILHRHGIPVMINGDSHQARYLDGGFGEAADLLRELGYTLVKVMRQGVFVDQPL